MERLHDACGIVGIYTRGEKSTLRSAGSEGSILEMRPDNDYLSPRQGPRVSTFGQSGRKEVPTSRSVESKGSIDVRRYLTLALTALQHRGQESAGMAVYDGEGKIVHRVGMGKVREVFSDTGTGLPETQCGIGHVRYSTTGSSCVENAGPFVVGDEPPHYAALAVAHNGNLVNGPALREQLPQELLNSTTDSEAIALLLLHAEGPGLRERMLEVFPRLRGAYSLVILAEGKLYAMRDPWGMRPLCIGRIGESWIVASESCALDRVGASYVREVEPGELITLDEKGMHAELLTQAPRQTMCVFEYIYFSDATSRLSGKYVYSVREALGRELAHEHPVEADLVVPVPDSSIPAALGYAAASGIPYGQAIIKNRYSDRSFIKPDQRLRELEVDLKFNMVKPKIEGARLIIVDDSIVRGNTMKRLVAALRHQGVKEIHLRSSAPPLRHPCYFGIDIPQEDELIAAGRSVQEIADYIGVDSLGYLSVAGLGRVLVPLEGEEVNDQTARGYLHSKFCYGCMEKQGWPFNPLEAQKVVGSKREMAIRLGQ